MLGKIIVILFLGGVGAIFIALIISMILVVAGAATALITEDHGVPPPGTIPTTDREDWETWE